MMKTLARLRFLFLALLLIVSFALRFWRISSVPLGLTVDEANFGYIAHSLAQTGKDEHGFSYPILFQAFGEGKLPALAYILFPLARFTGTMNSFLLRSPSALFGTISIGLFYWLCRRFNLRVKTSLIMTALFSFSPAPFYLSRIAFESNIALTGFLLGLVGIAGFLTPSTKPKILLRDSLFLALGWSLSWYSYIAYRPVMICLLLGLVFYLFISKKLFSSVHKKYSLLASGLMFLLILPSLIFVPLSSNGDRFRQTSFFYEEGIALQVVEKRDYCIRAGLPSSYCYLSYNKAVSSIAILRERFLTTFGLNYQVLEGERTPFIHVMGFGQTYLVVYLLLIPGIIVLYRRLFNPQQADPSYLIIFGILLMVLPAISSGDPQKVRLSGLLPFIFLLSALGLQLLLEHRSRAKMIAIRIVLALLFFEALYISWQHYTDFFAYDTTFHDHAHLSFLPKLNHRLAELDADHIIFKVSYPDPIMFYAYYNLLDPVIFQQQEVLGEKEPSGFQHTVALGDYLQIVDHKLTLFDLACDSDLPADKSIYAVIGDGDDLKDLRVMLELEGVEFIRSYNGTHIYLAIVDLHQYAAQICQN
ncbi:phospholipid carrier-dependent glycosyltransferase [Microgenomates group bacterium]|nr:phospholipid carrier-dependent glycosyltransferase [Microgenomates group bacterium]